MLYFEMQNVRVFEENTLFEMTPNRMQTKFKEMYLKKRYANKELDVLPFSVIYGANASGKSTIIKAMALLREIVLSGKIYSDNSNSLLYNIGLFPFLHDYNNFVKPMKLSIGFIFNEIKYEYSIVMQFSMPNTEYYVERKIIEEVLYVNDKEKFYRNTKEIIIDGREKKVIGENEAINGEELYLYGSFKSNIETNKYYQDIQNWFRLDFIIIPDVNTLKINIEGPVIPHGTSINIRNEIIDAALKTADFGPQTLFYKVSNGDNGNAGFQMRSLYEVKDYIGKAIETNAKNTESNGTLKLVDVSMCIIMALSRGSTVVIDELDSSFHVALIKELLNLFTNKKINSKGAQLIFSSHNLTFMNLTSIRKDQIYFVEKDQAAHTSSLYSLTDFKTNSETDVRNGERYIKNYLEGKYGAFPTFNLEEAITNYLTKFKKNNVMQTTGEENGEKIN